MLKSLDFHQLNVYDEKNDDNNDKYYPQIYLEQYIDKKKWKYRRLGKLKNSY